MVTIIIIHFQLYRNNIFFSDNKKYLKLCLKQTQEKIRNMESKKIQMYENIDKEIEKYGLLSIIYKLFLTMNYYNFRLHNEINKRSVELKTLVDKNLSEIVDEFTNHTRVFNNLIQNNKYYMDLSKSLLSHGKTLDVTELSKYVLLQLNIHLNSIIFCKID